MSTPEQRIEFDAHGFVRLHGVFTADEAARMRRVVWSELERRYGVVEDDRATWSVPIPTGLRSSKKHRAFAAIGTPGLFDAIDGLLGAGEWSRPDHWGQVMVTFPAVGASWRVPSKLWHVDWFYSNTPEPLFGLKVFAFFGDVVPCGGGTLVVSGSHRVVERFVADRPVEARKDFRANRLRFMHHDPWLRELARGDDPNPSRNAYFMETDHDLGGIAVRVVELTGRPGDVVLAHPWLLHHAAPNTASYPRLMRGKNLHCRRASWDV
ncbi:MAG TPA: phytanoyl-CoA dioxygenase family protein [Acidimicrobiia bacterium]|nr:phytanoyl-CoA dioxygenase family protein [Acidimicrobiia bacterium]